MNNFGPLQAFLEAYCLRRTESCLPLPVSRTEMVSLNFSPQEQMVYDKALSDTRSQIDEIVSAGQTTRCTKLFTMLLRLRMICNSGTLEIPSTISSGSMVSRSQLAIPGGLSDQCERCAKNNEDSRMLLSHLEVCPDCGRPLQDRSPSPLPAAVKRREAIENTIQPITLGGAEDPVKEKHSTKLHAVWEKLVATTTGKDKASVLSALFFMIREFATDQQPNHADT